MKHHFPGSSRGRRCIEPCTGYIGGFVHILQGGLWWDDGGVGFTTHTSSGGGVNGMVSASPASIADNKI